MSRYGGVDPSFASPLLDSLCDRGLGWIGVCCFATMFFKGAVEW